VSGRSIFAATDRHGVMISSNGINWSESRHGLPSNVRIISITDYMGSIVLGTYAHGIFVSTDDGSTWQPASQGLTDLTVRALAGHHSNLFAGTNAGIFVSSDRGRSWEISKAGDHSAPLQINNFASDDSQIYAATNRGAIRSADGGQTWNLIFKGAVNKVTVTDKDITLLDFMGDVFHAKTNDGLWLKEALFLPPRMSVQLTPASPKFLLDEFGKASEEMSRCHNYRGLPSSTGFLHFIATPVGYLTSTSYE
jgi:hypothetical protein